MEGLGLWVVVAVEGVDIVMWGFASAEDVARLGRVWLLGSGGDVSAVADDLLL